MNGPGPVSFSEIQSWASITQTQITSEEGLILRLLSRDYCGSYHDSAGRNAPPPYAGDDDENRALAAGIMDAVRRQKDRLHG